MLHSVDAEVPAILSVRGEIMMPISVWKALNLQREQDGKEIFANTRNAAAGSVKLLDSGEVARRNLFCFVYDVLYAETADGERIECDLTTFNFPYVNLNIAPTTIAEIVQTCQNPATKQILHEQDFDFDGLVIKVVNQRGERALLGSTTHHPRR
jgi:DNA ligase (NAD+)